MLKKSHSDRRKCLCDQCTSLVTLWCFLIFVVVVFCNIILLPFLPLLLFRTVMSSMILVGCFPGMGTKFFRHLRGIVTINFGFTESLNAFFNKRFSQHSVPLFFGDENFLFSSVMVDTISSFPLDSRHALYVS